MTSKTAICLDLDGTITREEILPIIASSLGMHEEIAALTTATIKGVIAFESSFKLRVSLLKAYPVQKVRESIRGVSLHENIVKLAKQHPDNFFIVTGNLDVWIEELAQKIGISCLCSKALMDHGEIQGIHNILDKGKAVVELKNRFDRVVAVGEGMNDIPMFEKADVSIAFGGVHTPVKTAYEMCDLVINEEGALCHVLKTLL